MPPPCDVPFALTAMKGICTCASFHGGGTRASDKEKMASAVLHAAFSGYLGEDDKEQWKKYDATELLKTYSGRRLPVLMDTGTGDNFLKVCKPSSKQSFSHASTDAHRSPATRVCSIWNLEVTSWFSGRAAAS
jgi:S-formylglutathione hydrolase FrmB